MNKFLKKLLESNIDLVESNDFENLYKLANKTGVSTELTVSSRFEYANALERTRLQADLIVIFFNDDFINASSPISVIWSGISN